jgi:hypothetical protein
MRAGTTPRMNRRAFRHFLMPARICVNECGGNENDILVPSVFNPRMTGLYCSCFP